ncbi:hypothetical protein KIW84_034746 [Lathyrus oleraceus]|uniref:Uncharacterized protein n=1 Tax=Pisum sativum TaxID=3888 RepID=A0A9D4Y077_PEA|nr:hypothetical protein KIW84_034746 [Pisum sativum]
MFNVPPRANRPRRDINYPRIEFAEGIDRENQRNIYDKIFKRGILATRYHDDASLCALGLFDSVCWMLNNLGMSHIRSLISPTYIRLTYEFLSSFRYATPIGGSRTTDAAHFRMFNRNDSINQDQLSGLLLFHHGDEFSFRHPLENEWKSSALDFWHQSTSSEYQPREEYDYIAMWTTLDDVLSELRHRNDADVDCDVLLRHIQRQQEEMRVTIDQIRETQLDFVERTKLNMGDLIEQMTVVHLEVEGMREYMQHVPNPAFGRGGFARHRGRGRYH